MAPMESEPAFWNGRHRVQRGVAPTTLPIGPMDRAPVFWNGHQWVQRRIAPANTSNIYSTLPCPVFPGNFTIEQLCGMGDAVLFDPQGQTRLPIAGVGLSRALNKALDTETNPQWPEPRRPEEMESGISPRPGWTSQEQARRVAVAVPGSQAPVVTTSGVALRHPQLKLPSNNQSAMASGQSAQKILTEARQRSAYQCDECTQAKGRLVSFSCKQGLQRHLRRTETHNAPPAARCSCGKTVARADAMRTHHKHCQGTTVDL